MTPSSRSVIVLDDDQTSLREISQKLAPRYKVLPTPDLHVAMRFLEDDRTVVLFVVSQSFKRMPWTQILQEVRSLRPNVKRVLQTPYGDLTDIMPGLHNGSVNQIISKPAASGEIATL
jgi:response regulator RpfG family c-di-GMP phosphodiesterase